MVRKDFAQRFLLPVCIVLAVATISFVGYFGSRRIGNDTLHQLMAALFGTTYFISVAFGTLYVFTTGLVRGASLGERILASAVTPFLWMTKEVLRLTHSHPFAECLYWYFNPLNFWLISLMVLQMGIATLIGRRILSRRGVHVRSSSRAPALVILLSLAIVISAYAWGKGENLYVIFLAGYRVIFGSGI